MSRSRIFLLLCTGLTLCTGFVFHSSLQAADLFDRDPINYLTSTPNDPVARIQAELDAGQRQLKYDPQQGYLPALLEALEIPVSSQGLVFSKTSLQQRFISPESPRAIYFNDDTYVGWIPHAKVLEISTVDPKLGGIFYTLDQREADAPILERKTHECLQCHSTSHTRDVPGHLVRSVFATKTGRVNFGMGTHLVDDQTPFDDRWGGWFVTGTHGTAKHLGNNFVETVNDDDTEFDAATGSNIKDLSPFLNTERYPSPHSDIVALLVLEHQTQMHNALTQANYYGQLALHDETLIKSMLAQSSVNESGDAADNAPIEEYERSESIQRRIDNAARRLVQALLFKGSAPFTSPIMGTSDFAKEFVAQGPFDSEGRSLRQLDLQNRILKYPCSYLIYSDAFDKLPAPVKESAYQQLWDILTERNKDDDYAHLDSDQRQAILEILQQTKTDLPPYWKKAGSDS
ncbi:hypothetical protein Pla110_06470 [Polystyrenella longa]|uniref:Cytochrome c domain-containing protein n=1 Tax=Polystyrenella longa TaxID=2528007 RepID=A0A518CI80_9PLAN|nr:hypothetical protein [Polystyrenella longa]QDU78943.1 hypothetical protein Pla110_06470 [Polystyrenella longa]